jgi:hypothetical protein
MDSALRILLRIKGSKTLIIPPRSQIRCTLEAVESLDMSQRLTGGFQKKSTPLHTVSHNALNNL